MARECRGDAQGAATTGADRWIEARPLTDERYILAIDLVRRGVRYHQQLPDGDKPGSTAAIGEKAIMADAVEAIGQAVEQEAADELVRVERHESGCVAMVVVPPTKGHGRVVGADQTAVGDGDPVGVAPEIGEKLFGRSERRLGIDDPVLATKLPDRRGKDIRVTTPVERAGEAQSPGGIGRLEPFEEQPPE
ncbi:hypothetical protein Sbs19_40710 [Sphingobium sp. BS19]|nr:hypothetical protein Sbs19_40710 [Sphingobium sp. BS19]